MKRTFTHCLAIFSALIVLMSSSSAFGQAKITMDDDRWVTIGGGLRTSFRSTETFADSDTYSKSFVLDSVRLYVNSQLHKDFKVEFNTEYDGSGDIMVLDAVVKYQPSPYFNVWMGRHLVPTDRANLDGPYFLNAYDYPGLVSRYPSIFAGRDNGMSVNGEVKEGKFKYAFGVYNGMESVGTADSLLYGGRLVANFLDPESGYYNSSTYYGEKDVLALGWAFNYQSDVVPTVGEPESFFGYNFDLLFEKNLMNAGVVSIEGAFYDYDYNDSLAFGDGSAFLAQGSFLINKELGIGKIQPMIRYQDFRDTSLLDIGAGYIIRGHNARLHFTYSQFETPITVGGTPVDWQKSNQFTFGTQFQF